MSHLKNETHESITAWEVPVRSRAIHLFMSVVFLCTTIWYGATSYDAFARGTVPTRAALALVFIVGMLLTSWTARHFVYNVMARRAILKCYELYLALLEENGNEPVLFSQVSGATITVTLRSGNEIELQVEFPDDPERHDIIILTQRVVFSRIVGPLSHRDVQRLTVPAEGRVVPVLA